MHRRLFAEMPTSTFCPLCDEPLTPSETCTHCGFSDRSVSKPIPIVTVVRDYRLDQVHVERFIPEPNQTAVVRIEQRRRTRVQSFRVVVLVLSMTLLLPLIGPLVMWLVRG